MPGSPDRSPVKKRGSATAGVDGGSLSPRGKKAPPPQLVGGKKLPAGEGSPTVGKKAAVPQLDQVLSSARKTFLYSTDQMKSPQKRPYRESTPSPVKISSNHIGGQTGVPLSPASLKKAGIGSPPKKKPKLWKSKWQLATLSGGFSETGKKKRASEASRLLDDEGVIHMLNRVPSVYGMLPPGPNSTNPVRGQRARNVASHKAKQQPAESNNKKATKTAAGSGPAAVVEGRRPPPTTTSSTEPVKVEENQPQFQIKDLKPDPDPVSPRRAARIQPTASTSAAYYNDIRESLTASKSSEDGFGLLKDLPVEQLELLANCDIRYSLPAQGLPVPLLPPAAPAAADLQRQLGLSSSSTSSETRKQMPSPRQQQPQPVKLVSKHLDKKKLVPTDVTMPTVSSCCGSCSAAAASSSWTAPAPPTG